METGLPRKHCMSLWIRNVFLYPSLLFSPCVFPLLFCFLVLFFPDFPIFDRPAAVSQKVLRGSRRRAPQMEEMDGRQVGICAFQEKKMGREGICFGNWGDLVFNQKQHIGIGRKCWMAFKREWWWGGHCKQKSGKTEVVRESCRDEDGGR